MITIQRAREILEAFGPCSEVYECMTAEDLMLAINEFGGTPNDWVICELECFDVCSDKEAYVAYEVEAGAGPKGYHDRIITERREMRAAIVQRLNAIGFLVS